MRKHWWKIVAVVLMLAGIVVYILTLDESLTVEPVDEPPATAE